MTPVKQLDSILIKPVGSDCQVACQYCFYLGKGTKLAHQEHHMTDIVLETMIRQIMQSGSHAVSFGWQGGEPTLAGIDFFKHAIELQNKWREPDQRVSNVLQTNGLLLNEKWAEFLKTSGFLVGLSLDGPKQIHDTYRKTRGGESTFDRAISRARMLIRTKTPVNVLCVVNDISVCVPDMIYDFFKSEGLAWMQFIPCREYGLTGDLEPFSVDAEEYGLFLIRIFDRWIADIKNNRPKTSIRWFESLLFGYADMPPPECTLQHTCGNYLVIERNGDVYPCDFYVKPEQCLGNILDNDLLELLNHPHQINFGNIKHDLPLTCHQCQWLEQCRGGCPKDRLPSGEQGLCEAYKMFFTHASGTFEMLARKWVEKNRSTKPIASKKVKRYQ